MKKLLIALGLFWLVGCVGCGSMEMGASHMISDTVKLNRKVTLYTMDGTVIREWQGRIFVEADGSRVSFMYNGKRVTLNGTYVIEELP